MLAAVDGEGHAELPQVGLAVGLTGLFVARLHGNHQRGTEDAQNGDDHQQLDEREGEARLA